MGAELTPQQKKFVREYVKTPIGTQAAIKAGYKESAAKVAASRLLTNVNVIEAIKVAQDKANAESELSARWVRERLMKQAEREDEAASHAACVSALGLLGKHLRMFDQEGDRDRRTVEVHVYLPDNGHLRQPVTIDAPKPEPAAIDAARPADYDPAFDEGEG